MRHPILPHAPNYKTDMKATFKDIMSQLQKKEYAPVYFLAGEEPLYIDKISRYIEENVIDESNRDFNQAVFYAKDTEIDEVVANAREFPFGSEKRVVIAKEAKDWPDLDALKAYAKNPSPSTILVICYKYAKLKAELASAFDKEGVVFESPKVQDYNLAKWVLTCAEEHKYKISQQTAELIAEHIGNDLSRIDNEFFKLKIFVPEGSEITPEVVEKFIGISNQYNVFALRDALVERQAALAYKIVDVFGQNIKSNSIIAAIASLFSYYNALLSFHFAPKKDLEEQRALFGNRQSPAQLQRHARIALGYSTASLIKIISILREFDARAKGVDNSVQEAELYKELVYRILH